MDEINQINKDRIVVGLDIGNSKIGVFIGQIEDHEQVRVLGFASNELKKGEANELEAIVNCLELSIRQAENLTGIDVCDVYVGISGNHIRSIAGRGTVSLLRSGNEVTEQDIELAVEQAKSIQISADQEIIHCLVGNFTVDEQGGIKNPIGMSGMRLTAEVQLVTAKAGALANIRKSVERVGLHIVSMVLEPLASAFAILLEDEKELGVAVIDIGAESTDVIIFQGDVVCYTVSLNFAGNNVTNDIAIYFKTPKDRAEEIKKKYGTVMFSNLLEEEMVPVPGVGGREETPHKREILARIINERMKEIFNLISEDIERKKLNKVIGAGFVLTGGGSSIEGLVELAEKVFNAPVRRGTPQKSMGLGESIAMPSYSTGVGLLNYGAKHYKPSARDKVPNFAKSAFRKALGFLKNIF
ncbi:MAG: cell division protein FtsA [Fibrobacter sp.]|jgi:cell division protein FtsA|nr:cell division protein FtsA [Fibrobacter sp.]